MLMRSQVHAPLRVGLQSSVTKFSGSKAPTTFWTSLDEGHGNYFLSESLRNGRQGRSVVKIRLVKGGQHPTRE
jgi:hypothetical protein